LIEQEKNMTRFVSISIALISSLTLFVLFAFVGCGNQPNSNIKPMTGTPTPGFTCGGKSTKQIITAMYAVIESKGWTDQERQFNITADISATLPKPKVIISGWSKDRGLIIDALEQAAGGCAVDSDNFFVDKAQLGSNPNAPSANYVMRIGCPPNYGPCGDICIPIGEPCKITSENATNTAWPCATYKAEDSKVVMPSTSSNGNVKSSNSSQGRR